MMFGDSQAEDTRSGRTLDGISGQLLQAENLLRAFWRKQHPEGHKQLGMDFQSAFSISSNRAIVPEHHSEG